MATNTSIQLIRNATLLINYAGQKILVDPMLMPKDTIDPLAGKARNPMVELPMPIEEIVKDVDLVLVTHTHPDHFDPVAAETLDKSIKLINQPADKEFFQQAIFTNAETVQDSTVWNGITIHRTGGEHGSGEILKRMGTVSGFVLQADNQPTIYIVADSIWIDEIEQSIQKYTPDYIVVNSGGAAFPGFEATPILMNEEQTMALIKKSGDAKVIAVHMDALDHCLTTRASLRQQAQKAAVEEGKLLIPQDGEEVQL
ncbi:MBL fold metallo-hydrolase [Pontibacter actiniarum]|uniref:MBL fold metallo-hydrolase n=1 Tax=Pontibacter actiniarum TaxID=323450 RepID=A0A1X9YRD7_9BACT|nr:MBL fold metallo-hydrolase [Pontibacter actiniarum]ARS35422.1 MBL fold metallo-hydrolase [Pontibacter actiniarum]